MTEPKMNLENIYQKISTIDSSNHLKAGLYFSIIQIKKHIPSLRNVGNSIYIDAKQFISIYINSIEERDLGYDIIDTNKILKCIELVEDKHEQLLLAQNSYRLLKASGFEEESKKIKKIVNIKKTSLLKNEPFCFSKYIKLLLHLSTYNIFTIILTIFFLFTVSFIVLLPAPFEKWEIYKVTYHSYSEVFIINHFVNILTNVFAIDNQFKIETNSLFGIFSIIILKFFYVIFIVNYLYKKVIDILNNN